MLPRLASVGAGLSKTSSAPFFSVPAAGDCEVRVGSVLAAIVNTSARRGQCSRTHRAVLQRARARARRERHTDGRVSAGGGPKGPELQRSVRVAAGAVRAAPGPVRAPPSPARWRSAAAACERRRKRQAAQAAERRRCGAGRPAAGHPGRVRRVPPVAAPPVRGGAGGWRCSGMARDACAHVHRRCGTTYIAITQVPTTATTYQHHLHH